MSHYLSNIAARSIQNDNVSMAPSSPVAVVIDKESASYNFQQPEFVQQSIDPVQPILFQNVKQYDTANRIDSPDPNINIEPSYFLKHIVRGAEVDENSPLHNQPFETGGFIIEEPSRKIVEASITDENKANETDFENITVPRIKPRKKIQQEPTNEKIENKPSLSGNTDEIQFGEKQIGRHWEPGQTAEKLPGKKQIIIAPVENEGQNSNEFLPSKSRIERITPNPTNIEDKRQIQYKIQQATPKLVIGKIVVEILPPVTPVSPKVINRVVQSSSKAVTTRSNKLSFGLGQL